MNVTWATYEFEVLNMDGMWKNVGGVYIFSGLKDNLWRAYYIGITDSFQDRHPNHERWEEAKRLGATHVHARGESQAAARETIERELIVTYQPPLNIGGPVIAIKTSSGHRA
jgi:predicted GIY-YIG superfamily endonuclease